MVFFTGIKRRAEELACKQVKKVEFNLKRLAAMRILVDEGYNQLAGNEPISRFGETLHKSWMLKRTLDDSISNSTVDQLYDEGISAGAIGGKLLGAGGGDSCSFVPPEKRSQVSAKLSRYQEVDFRTNAPGSHVVHASNQKEVVNIHTKIRRLLEKATF